MKKPVHISIMVRNISTKYGMRIYGIIPDYVGHTLLLPVLLLPVKFGIMAAILYLVVSHIYDTV